MNKEQTRLEIVLQLLRQGVPPSDVPDRAEALVKFVFGE
jgi:hypothetical protein